MITKPNTASPTSAARKIRPFADLIRGKNVDEALELLRFLPEPRRPAARGGRQERRRQRRGPGLPRTSTTWSSPSAASTAARCSSGSSPAPAARRSASSGGWPTSIVTLTDVEAVERRSDRGPAERNRPRPNAAARRRELTSTPARRAGRTPTPRTCEDRTMGQKVRPTGFRTGIMTDWRQHVVRQQAGLLRTAGRGLQDPRRSSRST